MTKVLITESTLDDIADAIRARNGTMKTFLPSEMPEAISNAGNTGGYIYPGWELGGINGNTGEEAPNDPNNPRIRSDFFSVGYPYIAIIDNTLSANSRMSVGVHRYQKNGTYVDHVYDLPVFNGAVYGYEFSTSYKYRLVSTNINGNPALVNISANNPDVYLGCGSISSGSFVNTSTSVATIKPFYVDEPSILKLNVPNCNIDLCYYENGTYKGALQNRDPNNKTFYFPLSPKYTYKLFINTTNYTSVSGEISLNFPLTQATGGNYHGIIIESDSNVRTSLINAAGYKYVRVYNDVTSNLVRYKDGVWDGSEPSETYIYNVNWPDGVGYIGDCDFFCIVSGFTNNVIKYTLTNDAPLYGKKWASYGDSITEQNRWQPQIVAKYGLVHSNHGLGGSCVTGDTTCSVTPMTDDTRINAIAADTDIITVMGGTNDFGYCTDMGSLDELQTSYDISTFIGSVATIVKKLQVHCPNAKIILMSNINSRGTTGQNRDSQEIGPYGYTPYDFAVAMKQAAEWLSVAYVDMWSCGINQLNRATYIQDSVHPNAAGGQLIARKLMEYLDVLEL